MGLNQEIKIIKNHGGFNWTAIQRFLNASLSSWDFLSGISQSSFWLNFEEKA